MTAGERPTARYAAAETATFTVVAVAAVWAHGLEAVPWLALGLIIGLAFKAYRRRARKDRTRP